MMPALLGVCHHVISCQASVSIESKQGALIVMFTWEAHMSRCEDYPCCGHGAGYCPRRRGKSIEQREAEAAARAAREAEQRKALLAEIGVVRRRRPVS